MAIIYKILFEVKLMHEYFLTDIDGRTVFEKTDQSDRMLFLLKEFSRGRVSISKDLFFAFPGDMTEDYKNYGLRIIPGYSGCKVAIRVNSKYLDDGTLVYEAFSAIPADFNIQMTISKRNGAMESYTNSVLSRPFQSVYFFTNENITGAKTYPFLVNDISPVDVSAKYQQGELSAISPGVIQEFYRDDSGDHWVPVAGSFFANENDRLLLPLKFYYSFNNVPLVTDVVFVLKDSLGAVIKTIPIAKIDSTQKALVDFSDKAAKIKPADPEKMYSLEVQGSDGFSKVHRIVFSDSLYSRENWGMISIRSTVTNADFNLITPDGFLIKRKSAAGIWTEAPIFEIPVKSRFAFLRYKNMLGKGLKLDALQTGYLFKKGQDLLSLEPVSLSREYFRLPKEGSSDTKYFPAPINFEIARDEDSKICLDIMVPESQSFPVV